MALSDQDNQLTRQRAALAKRGDLLSIPEWNDRILGPMQQQRGWQSVDSFEISYRFRFDPV